MRSGVCHLIFSISTAKVQLNEKERLKQFETLMENFKHPNIEIQIEATTAFKAFCLAYLNDNVQSDQKIIDKIHSMLKTSMVDENIAITRGCNMAFGVLSHGVIRALQDDLFNTIAKNCIFEGKESDDAETRRQAVKAFISVIKSVGVQNIPQEKIQSAIESFYQGLNDY